MGALITKGNSEAAENATAMNAIVSGAATEVMWLKPWSGGRSKPDKAVARETMGAVEKLAQQQAKERREEQERREAKKERLAGNIQTMLEVLGKQVRFLETVFQKEDELMSRVKTELRDMMEEHATSVSSLRAALDAAEETKEGREVAPTHMATEESLKLFSTTRQEAASIVEEIALAVLKARQEERETWERQVRESKDQEIRRYGK